MSEQRLPPGQYVPREFPALHYGPVPKFRQQRWDLCVYGATDSATTHRWDWSAFDELPRVEVVADFHCVTKFTIPDNAWSGVSSALMVELAPPADAATHVMVWAEYGYSANLRMDDFLRSDVLLATHHGVERISAERGYPVRLVVPHLYGWKSVKWVRAIEYLTADRRGFWEERGYHNRADPWSEQRFSYQEEPGEGPPLS
ncbi:molybdopterin-dependent oxidoreductase [Nocardiopsis ansamitocini]|uniref:Oxidoreductase n=1 Tax=Nocardiopsis ansamitocini TaxID=1670832 RepID=A0A9W6P2Q6_9ACTN|nr:molybdopterin-dependent oxidoreductase [Nocardiopsis ansamitocini]GLU46061.1 oxidoreductase [Nocardiopsis ansamitocini]